MSGTRTRVEIFSLLNFKRLAENEANHGDLVSDERILQYVERGLETFDEEVIKTSLRVLELLTDNPRSCEVLKKRDSIKGALKDLADRKFGVDAKMRSRAEKLVRVLDSSLKLINKEKLTWPRKVLTFHVTGLYPSTRKELEDILTKKVKGVLTVLIDVEHQRCIVTVYSHVEPKELAEAISESGFLYAQQILKNHRNQEILVPLIEHSRTPEPVQLPEYLEEDEDEPVDSKAMRPKDFRVTASEWFLTTAGFIQRSMYW